MAMIPRDVPISRDQVQGWINDWASKKPKVALQDYIRAEVDALNLPDPAVNTSGHDNLADSVPVADFILADLGSYRVPTGS